MSTNGDQRDNVSLSIPIGVLAAGMVIGLAVVGYTMLSGDREGGESGPTQVAKSARGGMRKFGLLGLATMIENDATRKLVVAALRAIARRG